MILQSFIVLDLVELAHKHRRSSFFVAPLSAVIHADNLQSLLSAAITSGLLISPSLTDQSCLNCGGSVSANPFLHAVAAWVAVTVPT